MADSRAAPSRERCAGGDVSTLTAAAAPIDGQVLEGRAEPRPWRVDIAPAPSGGGGRSATRYANLTGFPDLIVPAGFTGDGLPVGLSFLGRAFDEPRLLALGYAFEQATRARRLPVHTPPLGP